MAKTHTFSAPEELHQAFKKLCYAGNTTVSEEIQRFMQSEIDGTGKEFEKLKESVQELLDRVSEIEGDLGQQGGFNEEH